MSVTLACDVSLSKKLRALMGSSGSVVLSVDQMVGGKGQGILVINGNEITEQFALGDETSIMLTPTEVKQTLDIKTVTGNIFTDTTPNKVAQHIATLEPPQPEQMKVRYQDVKVDQLEPPPTLSPVAEEPLVQTQKKPQPLNYVKNYNDLVTELKRAISAQDITPPDVSGMNERQRAVALEKYEAMTGIETPCYLVNDSCLSLVINDLGKTLSYNMPLDIRNISAKKLLLSKDLRGVINQKFAKFISPDQVPMYQEIARKNEEKAYQSSDIFDSSEDAMAAVEAEGLRADGTVAGQTAPKMVLDRLEDIEAATEEEEMMRSLTGQMSQPMGESGVSLSGSARTTTHHNAPSVGADPFVGVGSPVKKIGKASGGIVARKDN